MRHLGANMDLSAQFGEKKNEIINHITNFIFFNRMDLFLGLMRWKVTFRRGNGLTRPKDLIGQQLVALNCT